MKGGCYVVHYSEYYRKDRKAWYPTYQDAEQAIKDIQAWTKWMYPNMKQVAYKVVSN